MSILDQITRIEISLKRIGYASIYRDRPNYDELIEYYSGLGYMLSAQTDTFDIKGGTKHVEYTEIKCPERY